jgi:XTP/dITP diphosphohydrolase
MLRARGEVEGQVLDAPRGENGFGYDPLFLIPSLGKTTAELPPEQKWAVSHRGNAFRELLRQVQETGIAQAG